MRLRAGRLVAAWNAFWFEPATPTDLGVCRVLFYTGLFLFYWPVDFGEWGQVSRAFWMPLPVFSLLHLGPFSTPVLENLSTIWRLSLALSAVGLFTRSSMIVAAMLGFYLLGLPHNFGHTYHFDALLVLALATMAASRAGDAWSIDALVSNRSNGASAEYTWPIRIVWTAMALIFFAAGLAKLRHGGLEWIASSNMQMILIRSAYHTSDADPITTLGLWLASHAWLSRLLAAMAVIVELGFITALVSPAARLVFVPAAALLLVGIRVTMGPTFGGFLIANVFWVPWQAIGERLAVRTRANAWLMYDGACALCTKTAAIVRRVDLLGRVRLMEVAAHGESVASRSPRLDRVAWLRDIHVVDRSGSITAGFDAYRILARNVPVGWLILPVLYFPGVAFLGRRAYRLIADHRTRVREIDRDAPIITPLEGAPADLPLVSTLSIRPAVERLSAAPLRAADLEFLNARETQRMRGDRAAGS
jgi:predicted DCC family thiol-disulfide oxidoreductase YuxK